MCFSSQASFIAGAALVAFSGFTIREAFQKGVRFLPLASFPFFFGVQQMSEGFLWVSINSSYSSPSAAAALVFLFFAYLFWPTWVPLSASLIEVDRRRQQIFQAICGIGVGLGMFLYLPVLFSPESLNIGIAKHSIQYENSQLYPKEATKNIARLFYALVICIPLVGSSDKGLRGFGFLIVVSVVVGFFFASHAFTSIWCFVAAVLSVYIYCVLHFRYPDTHQLVGRAEG
ncbi:DUF6629 family protein [Ruegeria arenilitoris]|uniref:DUF6629 family protein n=1 Tax=Ruegeria arenilitoris TaxID=1173585 RepID=UPI00147E2BEE|nr:DUF6629 family protein [Ruegeria arenilitoris]